MEAICSRGKNLTPFIESVIKAFRDMLIISVTGKCRSDFDEGEYKRLEEISAMYSSEKLLFAIKSLSEATASAKYMTNPRVVYEAALIKLCIKGNDGSVDALLARIGELERKLEGGNFTPPAAKEEVKKTSSYEKSEESEEASPSPPVFKPQSEFVEKIKSVWPEIIDDISDSIVLFTALENVSLREECGKLALTFPDSGGREMQDMVKDGLGRVKEAIAVHAGLQVDVITRTESDFGSRGFKKEHDPLDDIINLPITNN